MVVPLLNEMLKLNRQQWLSENELKNIQLAGLKRQVTRAWQHSPFYRERFESVGFHPSDLKRVSDLEKLPVVTKAELVGAGRDAYCSDIDLDSCLKLSTSGSSGKPISLPFTKHDKSHRVLKELRALMANGYKMTDRMLILVDPDDMVKGKLLPQKLGLLRRDYMSIFDDESVQLPRMKALRPHVLYSYTSTLRILAERLVSGQELIPTPKILMTAAELLDPATRKLLREAFGVEPVDFYGCMEFGWIAWQCQERDGYHINSDCLIMECLNNGKSAAPGEEGELVITNLHSDAAPLIRYAIGDTGILGEGKCACGRSLPMLKRVNGRLADCIVLPDGRKRSPYFITCAVENVPGVSQFQIVQEKEDSLIVRLVSGTGVSESAVRDTIRNALGVPVNVTVEVVESLQREANGKFKVVKSMVNTRKAVTASESIQDGVPGGIS